MTELRRWLGEPVDAASCGAFRLLFGAVMVLSTLRFAAKGWIDAFYIAPRYHFGWPGFEWLSDWLPHAPAWLLHAWLAVIGLSALGIALGLWLRASALVFFVAFVGTELFDKTYYLNHYYLVALVAALCAVLPLDRAFAIRPRQRAHVPSTVPRAVLLLLRAQLMLVYAFAGLAKLDGDWLLRAEPLATWLASSAGTPVVGTLLAAPATAHVASWLGALFDLSIALFLCLPRTRSWAVGAVGAFHVATGLLLPIGIFPAIMIVLAPIFLSPSWPRRALVRLGVRAAPTPDIAPAGPPLSAPRLALLAGYLTLQLALPLRHLLYPGPVNWTEEGFRFAWRVMLIEKTGHVELRVRDPKTKREWTVSPRAELTAMQTQMMSTQPDMIAQYARHLAHVYARRGVRDVEVYADSWASLNGRLAQRLIDPGADLARAEHPFAPRTDLIPLKD